jgi:hypothetical protein
MLSKTDFLIDLELLKSPVLYSPKGELPTTLNNPTGDFFYDSWTIKEEYKNTLWETLLNSLPVEYGEARVLVLQPGESYVCHADIDDRYHLNICSIKSFLIFFKTSTLYPVNTDGIWYNMDAGELHTAANFGRIPRIQLVVRHLLKNNILTNPVAVEICPTITDVDHARYIFDNSISPWLNRSNKNGSIANFKKLNHSVSFNIEADHIQTLQNIVPNNFFKIICQ